MIGLGDLPGGTISSGANAVSRDGSVVVGVARSAAGSEGFRWTPTGGIVGLGDFAGGKYESTAADVSADGKTIVGTANSANGPEAYRWTESTGMVGLGDLQNSGNVRSQANAISPNGNRITGHSRVPNSPYPNAQEAFRWNAATGMSSMSTTEASIGVGVGVSDNGVVVGQGAVDDKLEAVRWTPETGVVALGETFGGGATGVSADGRIVVGFTHGGSLSFIWRESVGLMSLRDVFSEFGLDTSDWSRLSVTDISADGTTLVGGGRRNDGTLEAWVAILPIPEPNGLALLSGALIPCTLGRRRGARLP
jgi:probable HAF family extracellular repeat protein